MKIFFICADDKVFLPKFFERIFIESKYEIAGVAIAADPNFKRFLQNSFKFMGLRLFFNEILAQVILRIKNYYYQMTNSTKVSSIQNICKMHSINCLKVAKVNSKSFREYLQNKNIDVLVSVACPQILKKKLLELPSKAAINVHYALLPNYRGQYPSFWVLAKGEEYTGVSVHFMAEKVDAGNILVQVKEKIADEDTFYTLVGRLKTTIGPAALLTALDKIANNDMTMITNDISQGSYFSFPTRQDMKRFQSRGRRWR